MDQKRWLFARIFVRRFHLRQRLKANSQIFADALVTISGLVDSFRRKKRIATKTRGVFRNSISKISVEDYRRIENPWLFHAFTFHLRGLLLCGSHLKYNQPWIAHPLIKFP